MKTREFFEEIHSIPWYITQYMGELQENWSLPKLLFCLYFGPTLIFAPYFIVNERYPDISATTLVIPWIIAFLCIVVEYLNKCVIAEHIPVIEEISGNPVPCTWYFFFFGNALMRSQQRDNIGYLFFRFFFIPIFPLRCYYYELIDSEIIGTRQTTTYRFYSRAKSNGWEILGIYIHFFNKIIIAIDMFFVMQSIYYFLFWVFS